VLEEGTPAMRANNRPFGFGRLAVALLFVPTFASPSLAQSSGAQLTLPSALRPGATIWLTDSSGQEERTRVVSVSDDAVTTTAGGGIRRVGIGDIARVRVRQFDSLLDGALIGAGGAVAAGLFLCTRTEPWENCRDDVGPMLRSAAVGAGVGIGVDALIRGRKTIYKASPGRARLHVSPVVGRDAGGVALALVF
jgi:hypothetical protein